MGLIALVALGGRAATAQVSPAPVELIRGDAVITGFSGIVGPDPSKPLPRGKSAIDLTTIDLNGASAEIVDLTAPGRPLDASLVSAPTKLKVTAGQVGQVFGVAIGDRSRPDVAPDIFLGATSVFGLQISHRTPAGVVERLKAGAPGAQWAEGQFGLGLQGGPGAIYRVDGASGAVTLLANVMLDGVPNPGPGLGNLAYDAAHKQIFVSDLYTGMIHRIGLDGADLGHLDHGGAVRPAAQMPPAPFDPRRRVNIANAAFDVNAPASWTLAPAARQVWAVAVNGQRLYYSVLEGPQIWSVGIQPNGDFAPDARLEVELPAQPNPLAVTDIAFSPQGTMVVAQRNAFGAGFYDYSAFTASGEPRVLRFWPKKPNDPPSPGLWNPAPEEIPVGFAGNGRNSNGGVAFGYGYDQRGAMSANACGGSLLVTGENLRLNASLRDRLSRGGPLSVDGLQISPSDIVRDPNAPQPWLSYFVDYDGKFPDGATPAGSQGVVRTLTAPCPPVQMLAGGPVGGGPAFVAGGGGGFVDGGGNGGGGNGDDGCVGPDCNRCDRQDCCPPGTRFENRRCLRPVDIEVDKTGKTSPQWNANGYFWQFTVKNNGGPFTAASGTVTVTDQAPPGMTFSTPIVAPAGWTCSLPNPPLTAPFTCTWNSTTVPAGVFGTFNIVGTPTGKGPYPPFTNCAVVSLKPGSGLHDTNPANDKSCATVTKPVGEVIVVKKVQNKTEGNVTGYMFPVDVVCNPSPSTTLTLVNGVPQTVQNIPWGANCSASENTASLPVPANACMPPLHPVWSTVISASVTVGNTPQTITVTNILKCERVKPNTLTVIKKVENKGPLPIPASTTYAISVNCGGVITNMNLHNGGSQTVNNIPTTTSCTVSETPPTVNACPPRMTPNWTTAYSPWSTGAVPPSTTVTVLNVLTCKPVDKVCTPPMVLNQAGECVCPAPSIPGPVLGQCICPTGSQMVGGKCVTVDYICPPPLVMNNAGTCVCPPPMIPGPVKDQCLCPQGTHMVDGKCVPIDKTCAPPLVMNQAGECVCPQGTHMVGGKCLPIDKVCQPPLVMNAKGECVCPAGTHSVGGRCIPDIRACKPPLVMNADGSCVRKPIVCPANMSPSSSGRSCVCDDGMVRYRGTCQAPAPRKERAKPAPRQRIVCEAPARLRHGVCVTPRPKERAKPRREEPEFPRIIPRGFPIPNIFQGGGGRGDGGPRGGGETAPGPRGGGAAPGRF
jgi:hypothetical protein